MVATPRQDTHGILYVATQGDRYIEEAAISADSVKRMAPSVPVMLVTDRPDHKLCSSKLFDKVEMVQPIPLKTSTWAKGQLLRIQSLRKSEFQRTLHLDTDTLIVTADLEKIFQLLDRYDLCFAEAHVDDSFSRSQFGKPLFNTGVCLYRNSNAFANFAVSWFDRSAKNFHTAALRLLPELRDLEKIKDEAVVRQLLCCDQISLAEMLSPEHNETELKVGVLDYAWNFRGSQLTARTQQSAWILHLPRPDVSLHEKEVERVYSVWHC